MHFLRPNSGISTSTVHVLCHTYLLLGLTSFSAFETFAESQDGTLDALRAADLFPEGSRGSTQSFSIRSLGRRLMQAATASTSVASTGTQTIPEEYTLVCFSSLPLPLHVVHMPVTSSVQRPLLQ